VAILTRFFRRARGVRRKRFPTQPTRLFVLLGPLRLTKADARAAAILVDELDASIF
jgi:hypothetical protein